jgi:hypothetical protein
MTSPNGWTLDTLEKYLSNKIEFLRESIELALRTSDKALDKSEAAIEKRFDAVNEFRSALQDQTQTYLTKATYSLEHKNISDKIEALTIRLGDTEARSSGKTAGIGLIGSLVMGSVTIIAALVSLAAIIFSIVK